MKHLRFRWLLNVLVVGLAPWGSGEETTTEVVDELASTSETSVAQVTGLEPLASTQSTWVDKELIRTSQLRYSKYSNIELNTTLQKIGELRPEQRRTLLMEVQKRIRVHGHMLFVQSKTRFGSGPRKHLDELPNIEQVRLIATEVVDENLVSDQAARERFAREQKREKPKPPTIVKTKAFTK